MPQYIGVVTDVQKPTLRLQSQGHFYRVEARHVAEFTPGDLVAVEGSLDGDTIKKPTVYRVFPVSH